MDHAAVEELWDVKDAARFLKCSASYVYKAASRGELPCVRLGALLRFNPAALRALVQGGTAGVLPAADGK